MNYECEGYKMAPAPQCFALDVFSPTIRTFLGSSLRVTSLYRSFLFQFPEIQVGIMTMFTLVYSFQTFNTFCVHSMFTYCAIIVNQSYIKDFLNSASKAQISNFQMLDKVNDELYKRCLLLYFHVKNQELKLEDKVYGYPTDF